MVPRGFRTTVAATAVASAAVIAFGVPASAQDSSDILPPGFPCVHTNVYPFPVLDWGWGPLDGVPPRFVTAGGGSGLGFLDLYTPANEVTNFFHPGISTPLVSLLATNSLGFRHSGATAFQLRLRWADRADGDLLGFTTLVWEPAYNGNVGSNGWATSSNLGAGQWWSTRDIGGLTAHGPTKTLKEISDANPRAQVTEYGVNVGRTNAVSNGTADDIVYGCARWDFEPAPSGS